MAQVLAGGLPVCVGGILVAERLVTMIFGAGYGAATVPLQILLLVLPLAFIRNVSQAALLAHARQDQMLRTVAWAAGTNLVLNLALIPRWGMAGAAWATVATEAVRTILAARYVHHLELPMTGPRRFVRSGLAAGALAVVVVAAGSLPVLLTIALGALAYLAALVALGGIRLRRGALPELTV
jgi:O-antigen/teichoic acid export membrane protein